MELNSIPADLLSLIKLINTGLIEGFILPDQKTAAGLSLVLSEHGMASDIKERSRGFYVKINTSVDKSLWLPDEHIVNDLYLFRSPFLGLGAEELGEMLVKSFFFSLLTSFLKPKYLVFVSSAVKLTVETSPVINLLTELEAEGLELCSCRTSLEYYNLVQKLRVGKVINMIDLIQMINNTKRVVTL